MNSVSTSQKLHCVLITNNSLFTFFIEIITDYLETYKEHINKLCGYNAQIVIQNQVLYMVTTLLFRSKN
jgi:uncharacterized membrane protein